MPVQFSLLEILPIYNAVSRCFVSKGLKFSPLIMTLSGRIASSRSVSVPMAKYGISDKFWLHGWLLQLAKTW